MSKNLGMSDLTKQLIADLSQDLFRDAIKAHYHHGVPDGTSLNFHAIARDSVQAASSYLRVVHEELFSESVGPAITRERQMNAYYKGFELGILGQAISEGTAREELGELFDAHVDGWHAGCLRRGAQQASKRH